MTAASESSASVVIPTRNRSSLLVPKVEWLLTQSGVAEIVVVADGCTDDTLEALARVDDPRVVVVVHHEALGPVRSRLAGAARASGPWLAMLDDDDRHADGFVETLLEVATSSGAVAVSAPWLPPTADVAVALGGARAKPSMPRLDAVSSFPSRPWVETPFLTNNYLVRRKVFLDAGYADCYPVNFYREETDLFLSLHEAGHRLALTGETYSWLPESVDGGIDRKSRLRYEIWVIRNHTRFLRRHESTLRDLGELRGPVGIAAAWFALKRVGALARRWLAKRAGRRS